jgi:glycosyltransferase involved in cell wall biosynthesis
MKEKFHKHKNKFLYLPSWTIHIKKYVWNIKKKNIISLCGRFWAKEKNYELLIHILKKYDVSFLKNWKIYLIWEQTQSFEDKLKQLLKTKPELKQIIKSKGFIWEKEKLYSLLSKSKIFIHTANSEWEPNIQFDAMFCWCYMLSTDVGTIKMNYPKKFSTFTKINDEKKLFDKLKKTIPLTNTLKNKDFLEIQNHCIKNFTWEKSLKILLNKF